MCISRFQSQTETFHIQNVASPGLKTWKLEILKSWLEIAIDSFFGHGNKKQGILTWNSLNYIVGNDDKKLKKLLKINDDGLSNLILEKLKIISQHVNDSNDNEGAPTAYI